MELYEDLAIWAVLGKWYIILYKNSTQPKKIVVNVTNSFILYSKTGAATNGLARGIRNKPLAFRPLGYVYASFIGIGLGLAADAARKQQAEFANKRLDALLAAREARESQN